MIRHLHRCSSMRHHRLSFLAATTALATTATTANKPFGTRHLPASFQTDTHHSRFFHQSNGTSKSTWDNDKTQHHQDTLDTLKTLVHRLTQPPPLRAPIQQIADNSSSTTSSSPPFEEKRRLTELAKGFLDGYQDLPPMRLPARELEDDSSLSLILHPCQRFQILRYLSSECVPSLEAVERAVQKYKWRLHHQPSKGVSEHDALQIQKHSKESLSHLRNVLTPSYEELFAFLLQQNAVDAMAFLVTLREDLLQLQTYWKFESADRTNGISTGQLSQLQEVDKHLQSVFTTWFAPGMLELRRITYDQTSASIIEFISLKEAVHPLKSLEDLRRRLGPKRRVLALFHPLLPDKPLVFVHIALIEPKEGEEEDQTPLCLVPSTMKHVIAMDDPEQRVMGSKGSFTPKVATFYSISNGVKGLSGVGLGEILLKRAIESLREDLPSLEIFVTLSPIPGFRKWLQVKLEQQNDETLLSVHDRQQLVECGLVTSTEDRFSWGEFWDTLESIDLSTLLQHSHNKEENDCTAKQKEVLGDVLTKLACRYLALEKHRGKPLDGVCKFHVGNGAQLHNVHFAADLSRNGVNNSFGIMCNYLYDLDQLEQNCASFESSYTVPIGPSVYQWLQS